MATFRYTAIARDGGNRQRGEMSADSAADVRASLRRIGFRVLDVHAVRRQRRSGPEGRRGGVFDIVQRSAHMGAARHLRSRRRLVRADLCDSLATMLDSGMPVLESLATLMDAEVNFTSAQRTFLVHLQEDLREGASVAEAASHHPGWFDVGEVAMLEAGEQRGELGSALRNLAERHERSDDVSRRIVGTLVYPAIVLLAGLGVAVFLGSKTLPEIRTVLIQADIEVPALTDAVIAVADTILGWWHVILASVVLLAASLWLGRQIAQERRLPLPNWLARLSPKLLKRAALGSMCRRLAELVRSGVPFEEAMRVTVPTIRSGALREELAQGARAVETGTNVSEALSSPEWFDPEFRRLLDIGQSSGELDVILDRLGHRYERQAERFVDRFVTLMEPAVIIMLAGLVGIVVLAAILPFLRLQEIIG